MKNLYSSSVKNTTIPKFLFQNKSPEESQESVEITKKNLAEIAEKKTWKNFQQEQREILAEAIKYEKENPNDPFARANTLDIGGESGYMLFLKEPSFIKPQKGWSWEKLIRNSNDINSAKKTTDESTIDVPDIWNFLQNKQNIQKVSQYLEGQFGPLKLDDKVAVWFNKKEKKTEIHFQRDGKTTSIFFKDIK